MFRGINGINIDTKGRFIMPARCRERLHLESQGNVVITIDTNDRCLLLYPVVVWEEIEKAIASLPSFNPAARRIQRLLIGHATDIEMDSHGRLLLPPLLREFALLKKRAVVVGQGKKLEIWDEKHWESCRDQWLKEEISAEESPLPSEAQTLSL